jgi:hypothetical protein
MFLRAISGREYIENAYSGQKEKAPFVELWQDLVLQGKSWYMKWHKGRDRFHLYTYYHLL